MNNTHTIYENFYLSNEVEDQFDSHLNLQNFCTIDNTLTGTAGMKRKINVYRATAGTQKVAMGEGNTTSITVSYSPEEYVIEAAQNRFEYYDEQEMTDPMIVPTGTKHMGTDMYNTVNGDIYAEYLKGTQKVATSAFDFAAFADAQSMLDCEDLENVTMFAFINSADMAGLRKALGDDLKYVEAFVRKGYVGTVAGVNIYTKKDAQTGKVVLATPEAVTIFNKKGTEIEQERDANIRKNKIYSRKYYMVALTDTTKTVLIQKGTATITTDTTVTDGKVYYAKADNGYVVGTPTTNPKTEGFYEIA